MPELQQRFIQAPSTIGYGAEIVREKSVLRMHPWIFSGAVERVDGRAVPGATVDAVKIVVLEAPIHASQSAGTVGSPNAPVVVAPATSASAATLSVVLA